MLDEQTINNIRVQADIVDIISRYVSLTPKGKNYFGVCPFHEDHSPSMSVSTEKQIYKCFSCGESGNVFTFIENYENISFIEAVKRVADMCGIELKIANTKKSLPKNNKTEYEIMNLALKFYQNNLNTDYGNAAKKYLLERSLDNSTIKDFEIGLSLGFDHQLHSILLNKKYDLDTLINLGLVSSNDTNTHDTFINRIMFPIHNLEGEVVGFTGRIYENSSKEIAKYMNSKESVIFKKGHILFNYHRAKKEITKAKEVIIVEGNMDAIRLYSSGIKNCVALMGTSLTKEQVDIIRSMRAKIILMFDNDDAGEIATYNNGNILESSNINPYVVRLSGEKDPDEYIIKNGVNALIDNIKNPIPFLDFKLKYLKKNKDLTKTSDLVNYIKDIIASIKDIDDDLTKEITIKKMSDEYDIPLDLLKRELAKVTTIKKNIPKEEKKLAKKLLSKYDIAAEAIIYYMMNDIKYVDMFERDLGIFDNKTYRGIASEIIYYSKTHGFIDLASFITYVNTKDYIYDDTMEIIKHNKIEDLKVEDFKQLLNVASIEDAKKQIKDLKIAIASELDTNKKLELANKLIEIKKGCVGYEK